MISSLLGTGSSQSVADRNIRRLYLEIGFASILSAIITFNSAFAIHLGASDELVALLSAAPALIAAIGSIPSARFLSQRVNRKLWLFGSLLTLRVGYLVVAFIPIFFPPAHAAEWFTIWIIALNLPSIFFTNGFHVLIGDIVSQDRRAFVVARRQIIYSAGLIVVSALSGAWLDSVAFPLNYELMYAFGFVTVLGSQYFLNRLEFAAKQPRREVQAVPSEPVTMRPPIARLLVNMTIYQLGLSVPASLFNIYYIKSLHTSDGWIGLNSAAASAGVIAGYYMWERLLRKRTFGWSQRRATLLTWIFPVGLAFAHDLNVIMFMNFLVNMMHSGVDLSNFNVLLMISRPHERIAYISWFNTVVNISTFIAPLLGTVIADHYSIPVALVLSGVLRIIGGIMFNLNRVDTTAATAA